SADARRGRTQLPGGGGAGAAAGDRDVADVVQQCPAALPALPRQAPLLDGPAAAGPSGGGGAQRLPRLDRGVRVGGGGDERGVFGGGGGGGDGPYPCLR